MRHIVLTLLLAFVCLSPAIAQDNVGIGTTTPNAKAVLDVSSTNKGLLIPRMTTAQRLAIAPAATEDGMLVYDTDLKLFFFFDAGIPDWVGFPLDNDPTNELQDLMVADDTIYISNGAAAWLMDNDTTNEIQNLSIVGDTIYLSDGGQVVLPYDEDRDSTNEIQVLDIIGDTIYLSDGGSIVLPYDEDRDSTNEIQVLSIVGDTVYLSDGGSIILPYDEDRDSTNELQNLSIVQDTIYLSDGGQIVLPYDEDRDSTNEIQVLSIVGDTVYLSDGGSIVLPYDEDRDSTNELQNLSIVNDTIFLSNGGQVTLPYDEDRDSTNEIQVISWSNDTLYLSDGGMVYLPYDSADHDWHAQGTGAPPTSINDTIYTMGYVGINNTNPRSPLHIGNSYGGGLRPWMNQGVNMSFGTDNMYVGLKNEGAADDNDAVIAWGDNPPAVGSDDFRIIHIPTGGPVDGNEVMRIFPTGEVGIGNPAPTNQLHVTAGADPLRLEGLAVDATLNDIMVTDAAGVVHIRDISSLPDSQQITISGDTLFIDNGGFVVLPPDNDGDTTNELQTVTISGDTIFLSDGGFAVFNDSIGTDDQTLSISNDTLFIEDGNFVQIALDDHDWYEAGTTTAPDDITDNQFTLGQVGIGLNNPNNTLHLFETVGTPASTTTGSIFLEHGDAGGVSSIVFGSTANPTSDHAFIQYEDDGSGNGSTAENSLLRIEVANDVAGAPSQDDIALISSGGVGINTIAPSNTLHVFAATDPLRLEGVQYNPIDTLLVIDPTGVVYKRDINSLPTGTDDQTLTISNDTLFIEDGNFVQLTASDHDFYEVGTTTSPDDINDNQYTLGQVAIGIGVPTADLHVQGDDGVLHQGSFGAGTIPIVGGGVRMMWYPGKAAFRAGQILGTEWNDVNIGTHSAAFGMGTIASGNYSFVAGDSSTASGDYAVAIGHNTIAGGNAAAAFGQENNSTGDASLAGGFQSLASNSQAFAFGIRDTASGQFSVAMGNNNTSSGFSSTSFGKDNHASGFGSTAVGQFSTASGNNTMAGGYQSAATNNEAFAYGLHDTASGLYSVAMGNSNLASANSSVALGNNNNATGNNSTASGNNNTASNGNATAFGTGNTASGNASFAAGGGNQATNTRATAVGWGNRATGQAAVAMGYLSQSLNNVGIAIGWGDTATAQAAVAMGYLNLASGTASFAAGWGNKSTAQATTALGIFTTASGNNSFAAGLNSQATTWQATAMGNATLASGSNSFAIGNQGIASGNSSTVIGQLSSATNNGALAGGYQSSATGNEALAFGVRDTASGTQSVAMGWQNKATAGTSFAMGANNRASGGSATVFGQSNLASGGVSFAMGLLDTVSGYASSVFGRENNVSGNHAMGIGFQIDNPIFESVVIGRYNEALAGSAVAWAAADQLFVLANGTAATPNNAVTVLKNGNMGVGPSAPTNALHVSDVADPIRLEGMQYNALDTVLVIDPTGVVYKRELPAGGGPVGTDDQTLSISNDTLFIESGNFVQLPPDLVDDADNDPANELQALTSSNDTLFLSSGGFVVLPPDQVNDADADPINEIQALSISNDTIFLSSGGFVVLPAATSTDDQTLTISNDTLFIEDGNFVQIPPITDHDFYEVGTTTSPDDINDNQYTQGKVAIGLPAPVADLHVNGLDGFVHEGTYGSGAISATGAGTRMMWYPGKAAFRAGNITGTQWDDANIGNYSAAFGYNNTVSDIGGFAAGMDNTAANRRSVAFGTLNYSDGFNSFVGGYHSAALGNEAFAFGVNDTAVGGHSVAFGYYNKATSTASVAFGANSIADANYAFTVGNNNSALGFASITMGANNTATTTSSMAFGGSNAATSSYALAMGVNNLASGYGSAAFGNGNLSSSDHAVTFGESNTSSGNNAITGGFQSAATALNAFAFGNQDTASGNASVAMGELNTASGYTSTAIGYDNTASGYASTALGYQNVASGQVTTATGASNTVSGNYSFATGELNTVLGTHGFAAGNNNQVGTYAAAVGRNHTVLSAFSFAAGNMNSVGGNGSFVGGVGNTTNAVASTMAGQNNANNGAALYSVTFGYNNQTQGRAASTMGEDNIVTGQHAGAYGEGLIANAKAMTAIGKYNVGLGTDTLNAIVTDPVLEIGIGANAATRTNAMVVLHSGNVGIGENVPTNLLHVNAAADPARLEGLQVDNTLTDVVVADANGVLHISNAIGGPTPVARYGLVNTTGNWDVQATNGLNVDATADAVQLGGALTENTTITGGNFNTVWNLNGTGDFSVQDAGTQVLSVRDNGYVAVGNVAPTFKLHIIDNRAGDYTMYATNSSATGAAIQGYLLASDLNAIGGVTDNIDGVGTYGVHLPATGTGAGIMGATNATVTAWAGLFIGDIGYTGTLWAVSDKTYKKNVGQLSGALDKIMSLEAKTYEFDTDKYPGLGQTPGKLHYGYIAQDVQKIIPELVTANKKITDPTKDRAEATTTGGTEELLMMNYTELIPIMTEAMKEQQTQIEDLKAENEELQQKLDEILELLKTEE